MIYMSFEEYEAYQIELDNELSALYERHQSENDAFDRLPKDKDTADRKAALAIRQMYEYARLSEKDGGRRWIKFMRDPSERKEFIEKQEARYQESLKIIHEFWPLPWLKNVHMEDDKTLESLNRRIDDLNKKTLHARTTEELSAIHDERDHVKKLRDQHVRDLRGQGRNVEPEATKKEEEKAEKPLPEKNEAPKKEQKLKIRVTAEQQMATFAQQQTPAPPPATVTFTQLTKEQVEREKRIQEMKEEIDQMLSRKHGHGQGM